MHSTLQSSGMFHDKKMEVLKKAKYMIGNMRFLARDQANFCVKPFQTGLLNTINAVIMLHEDLKNNFNEPYLLTGSLNQDELERTFGEIRGLGGGFCLHPKGLQFLQRLGTVFENHRKVSFNIANEASYVYILSGQKPKMVHFGEFLKI